MCPAAISAHPAVGPQASVNDGAASVTVEIDDTVVVAVGSTGIVVVSCRVMTTSADSMTVVLAVVAPCVTVTTLVSVLGVGSAPMHEQAVWSAVGVRAERETRPAEVLHVEARFAPRGAHCVSRAARVTVAVEVEVAMDA